MATRQKNPASIAPVIEDDDPAVEIAAADIVEEGDEGDGAETEQPQVAEPDAGIEDLKRQLEAEKHRREEIERERDRLANQRATDQKEVADSRVLIIDAKIQQFETEKQSILAKIKEAKEAADYAAEVEALDELNRINIDLKQSKVGKSRLESEIEEAKNAPQPTQRDALETFIAETRLDQRSAAWLRSHPEYAFDTAKNAQLQRAHAYAMGHDDVTPASDEYFRLLEGKLGLGPQEPAPEPAPRMAQPSRPSAPSAPVSRNAGSGGGAREIYKGVVDLGNGKYRVSPAVREAAEMAGITVKEYVEQARAISRESDGQLH